MGSILEIGNIISSDKKLNKIAEKILNKQRLSFEDGVDLFETEDIHTLGKLADIKK
jgi:aminodeoxyfutalosine synthase